MTQLVPLHSTRLQGSSTPCRPAAQQFGRSEQRSVERQSAVVPRVNTVADSLLEQLADAGIDSYFGVPGGAIEPLFNALARQRARGKAHFTLTRSEAGAAFAADGYFRQTGKIAVCTTTAGPGISNAITGILSAGADRIPLLLITPQVGRAKQGRGAFQDSGNGGLDLAHMLRTGTKDSIDIADAAQLPHAIARLLSSALTAPMGPVHLSIPSDILQQAHRATHETKPLRPVVCRPVDDIPGLQRAARQFHRASQPVIYIGDDAGPGSARLTDLAYSMGVAVVSSPAGKRWLDHFHPAYLGVAGFSEHPEARRRLAQADFVLALGATFDELSTNGWTSFPDAPIVSIDQHSQHAHRLPGIDPIAGSAQVLLRQLLRTQGSAARPRPLRQRPPLCVAHPARPSPSEGAKGSVHPALLMDWLNRHLNRHVVVHVDAGNSFSWSTRYLKRAAPDTYRVAMGLSSMGWAIGAAIGCAAASRRRTVCLCGDGAWLMSSLELTVAVAEQLPVTYIVLNDSSLGMVKHGQALGGAESIAHEMPHVHFARLAKSCGAMGFRIKRLADLDSIAAHWLNGPSHGPCVLDVVVDSQAIPPINTRVDALRRQ